MRLFKKSTLTNAVSGAIPLVPERDGFASPGQAWTSPRGQAPPWVFGGFQIWNPKAGEINSASALTSKCSDLQTLSLPFRDFPGRLAST